MTFCIEFQKCFICKCILRQCIRHLKVTRSNNFTFAYVIQMHIHIMISERSAQIANGSFYHNKYWFPFSCCAKPWFSQHRSNLMSKNNQYLYTVQDCYLILSASKCNIWDALMFTWCLAVKAYEEGFLWKAAMHNFCEKQHCMNVSGKIKKYRWWW